MLLESGEYFLSDMKKSAKKWEEKQEKQAWRTAENKRRREEAFIPPEEQKQNCSAPLPEKDDDVSTVAMSLKKKAKEFGKRKSDEIDPESYIASVGEKSRRKKAKQV